MEEDINLLNELVETAKKKKVTLNPEAEKEMSQEIDELFAGLADIYKKVEHARKLKRKIDSVDNRKWDSDFY